MSLDVAIVGGGLSGGLLAYRLLQRHPGLALAVVESGPALGGKHIWSFHGTDVRPSQLEWMWPLISQSWPAHDVAFSTGPRRIGGGYHSIRSHEFHSKLMQLLGERLRLNTSVESVSAHAVVLRSGETIDAKCVIDARGFSQVPIDWRVGYQRFVGLHLRLKKPHALEVPLIMDARVEQHQTLRFVYVLPWNATEILIEDTAYADSAELDAPKISTRILAYAQQHGLEVDAVVDQESGALPIPLYHPRLRFSLPTIGMKAGLFHAATGYSLPQAVETADLIATRWKLDDSLGVSLQGHADRHYASMAFFRMLNRMLFRGPASADERVKVYEAFYGLSDERIARFYAGRLNLRDQFEILKNGAPSVPLWRAMKASFSS
jgi:lycopene beta-cyclase